MMSSTTLKLNIEVVKVEKREENLLRILQSQGVQNGNTELLREGKKLLVVNINYTLFDSRSCAETGVELIKPYLQEFLTSAYGDYDIVIWYERNMKRILVKLKELGMTVNANYKVTVMLVGATKTLYILKREDVKL